MKKYYFELLVKGSNLEPLKELVFDLGFTCIEEFDGGFFLRDEEDLSVCEFAINEFSKNLGIDITTTISQKENQDWVKKYQESVDPIRVGKFYVRPSWCEPDGNIDIIIDPAIAFGSGHHESTNSCLKLISQYIDPSIHKNALDVGCGSGILSIALKSLGLNVDACDTDIQACEATKENASKNNLILDDVFQGSATDTTKTYDVVIANIIADIILMLSKDLKNRVKPGGVLILSGILNKYKNRILNSFGDLKLIENKTQGDWESFIFKKEE